MSQITRRSFVVGGGGRRSLPPTASWPLRVPGSASPTEVAAADPEPYKFSLVGAADSPSPGASSTGRTRRLSRLLRGVAAFTLATRSARDPPAPPAHQRQRVELHRLRQGTGRADRPGGEKHVFDLAPGEVAFQPAGWPHWLENTGDEPMFAVFMYSLEQPETIDMPDVIPGLPKQGY